MFPRRNDLTALRPGRVCLIKPSSLGDIVHALPVLGALRRLWPQAHLAWVVNRGLRGLLDGHPDLDEVIPFDRGSMSLRPAGVIAMGRFLKALRRKQFDVAIDLQGLLRSGIMTQATGAPVRVGQENAREGATFFYTHRVPMPATETHAVDRLMEFSRAFGGFFPAQFQVSASRADFDWANRALIGVPRPRLMLNLGARWLTKRWPPARFAEVALRAVAERNAGVVVVGAPEDRPLVEALKLGLGSTSVLDLCGQTTLPQLACLAANSDVFLSNDTGPLHLAAAAGAATVGIYTCTSPLKTGPYGVMARSVATRVSCAASCRKVCPAMICMEELDAERVWAVVRDQLDQAPSRAASA